MFLFGKETAGLPRDFIAQHQETAIRIPMSADTRLRSFNLPIPRTLFYLKRCGSWVPGTEIAETGLEKGDCVWYNNCISILVFLFEVYDEARI